MSNSCPSLVQACAIRVSRLDASGVPAPGANNMIVTDALTQLAITPVIEAGDEFKVKNACGALCINVKDCDRLARLDLSLGLCKQDPQLQELLTDGVVLTSGGAVGYGFPRIGEAHCPNGVSVEVWAKRYDIGGSLDPAFPYEWFVLPKTFWQWDTRTFANGPIEVQLKGFAVENDNWYDGPTNNWPVASDRVLQSIPTNSLPTVKCGYTALVAS